MPSVLDSLREGSRIAVVRLRSLGDCVLTTPALEILKRARPDLRIAIVVEPAFAALFDGNPDVAEILMPGVGALRAWRPQLCLNLHGGTRSATLTAVSGASLRAAFSHLRHGFVYNIHIPTAQQILGVKRKVHTAEHLASAMFYLGAPVGEIPRARLFAPREVRTGAFAVLHSFASQPAKSWSPARFGAVARHLRSAQGLEPIFVGGARDDFSPVCEFECLAGASLARVKALLAGASLFVGNDSGPAHMAAAFGVPSAVLFGASDVDVWRPWRTAARVLQKPEGIAAITVEEVLAALEELREELRVPA